MLRTGAEGYPCVGFVIKRVEVDGGAVRWLYSARRAPLSGGQRRPIVPEEGELKAAATVEGDEELDEIVERVASLLGPDAEGEKDAAGITLNS